MRSAVAQTRVNAMAFFLLLSLSCIYYAKSQESQCMYQYLEQPPLDIICDPHNPQSTGLSLQCQVLALGPSSSYSVGWFYSPANQNEDQTVQISVTSTITDNISSATSTTTVTLTLRPPVDGSSPGFYYCQVLPADQSETIPSDNFTLYAPEDNHYLTFIICDSTKPRFKSEVKCAVPMVVDDPMNITGPQPTQNDGDAVDNITTGNDIAATTANYVPTQGDQPTTTTEGMTNNSTTVTCADSGAASKAMLYQIYVSVLTPIFLLILIVLITIVAVHLGRKCAHQYRSKEQEQQKKTEENTARDRQAGLNGLNQLRRSFHRVLGLQPRSTAYASSPLSSLDLQPNPSYLENSRNTALLQSRTCQASPLLEAQRKIQKPDPSRRDLTRQEEEDMFPNQQGSITSYEDNSYVIMRSSGTNSTYQSSGAYESML